MSLCHEVEHIRFDLNSAKAVVLDTSPFHAGSHGTVGDLPCSRYTFHITNLAQSLSHYFEAADSGCKRVLLVLVPISLFDDSR